jgi:hypothetical protein
MHDDHTRNWASTGTISRFSANARAGISRKSNFATACGKIVAKK